MTLQLLVWQQLLKLQTLTLLQVLSGVDGSADTALGQIAKSLGNVAAGMSALKAHQAVANSSAANLKAAAARISDTDYALETANLTKAAILNQSAMAMVAQANQAQQAILTVIQ